MDPRFDDPPTVPPRVRRAWTAGIIAGFTGIVAIAIATDAADSAESVVTDYFAAILDGDIDTALSLVDEHPTGASSRFLAPEAIADDWRVVSITDAGEGEYDRDRVVRVALGGPDGVAEGELLVTEDDDTGWRIANPTTTVQIALSPLDYIQVNGYTPKPQATDPGTASYLQTESIDLLPGLYSFYQDIPGVVRVAGTKTFAALSSDATDDRLDPDVYTPGEVVAGEKTIDSAREQLKELLTECVTATVPRPDGCPFGAGNFVNTPDGEHVEELTSLEWTLERMPKFKLVDSRYPDPDSPPAAETGRWSFQFVAAETDVLTLRGKGTNSDGKKIDFEAPCRVDLSTASATVERDGRVNLASLSMPDYYDGPMSCGKEV